MSLVKDYLDDLTAEQKAQLLGGAATFVLLLAVILAVTYYNMRDQDIVRECVKAGHSTAECRALVQ